MKTFKQYISQSKGLRFIYENLNINSGIGRTKLLNAVFLTKEFELKLAISTVSQTYDFVKSSKNQVVLNKLYHSLNEINDILASIRNLKAGRIADDIELFEIKKFALNSQIIKELCENSGFDLFLFNNLEELINILDPEKSRIPSFYIYNVYSDELTKLRKIKENSKTQAEKDSAWIKCVEIEDSIRKDLSKKLAKFTNKLEYNLTQLANLDIALAKANLALEFGLTEPKMSVKKTEYVKLFNPQIRQILELQNKKFQAIDILIQDQACLITGANMSGKTVLLKSVALSQLMFQFGFFVPALKAEIKPVDEIMLSVGDNQDEISGLSSFAMEMLNINNIIEAVKSGNVILALVDELARTTNPEEGKAIVSAFLQVMNENNVASLITTHYSGIETNSMRLRVKGLDGIKSTDKITVDNINDYMNYSLELVNIDKAPTEAIRIAEILGVDSNFIEIVKSKLK